MSRKDHQKLSREVADDLLSLSDIHDFIERFYDSDDEHVQHS